ncbi:ecto-ADP-ribosyltransferase 5-like isoform X3 [Gopherus evgoodei]|uniref:ecto-ADP-ribosyltransferase 5-like isoform X3 n=1 Tax=Gopherus evgoodei TaxID=1825980 RepID=UPI0011CF8857|nr:ecto-ADP-ribosyltransferase 5-like isoform X3 [Gopherus evgoodei]
MTFLLITVTYLCAHTLMDIPQVNCQPVLDMAYDAFDDQYIGCTEVMENIIKSKLLRQEKSTHKVFSKSWEAAKKQWNNKKKNLSLPIGFKDENGIAVLAYTSGDEEEVLIPVYERFRVSHFIQDKNSNMFVLHSTNRTFSLYNCAYIEGKKGRRWA